MTDAASASVLPTDPGGGGSAVPAAAAPAAAAPAVDVPAVDVVARFTSIITAIGQGIGQHLSRTPKPLWPPLVAILSPLWFRLSWLRPRFAAIVARARAGTLPPPRPPRARPERPLPPEGPPDTVAGAAPEAPSGGKRPRAKPAHPTGLGWLARLAPVGCHGLQLRSLLAEPEMAVLLGQAPQLGRMLRPLCHMLGVARADVPLLYPPTPRQERPPRPKATRPPRARASATRPPRPRPTRPRPAPPPTTATPAPTDDERWREIIAISRRVRER